MSSTKSASDLTDVELRNELGTYGVKTGPIAGTTRTFYEKKLEACRTGQSTIKPTKGSVKRTPSKTKEQQPAPVLAPTPLSAKKKSKRGSQSSLATESSDNELDLTIGDGSPVSRPGRAAVAASGKKKSDEQIIPAYASYSPPRPVTKRTPTPPRSSSIGKRTPLRESGDTSLSNRGNIFSSKDRDMKNFYSTPDQDDEDEDDHMESSRIISPSSRFDPFRNSLGVPNRAVRAQKEDSPVDKIKKYGQGMWGFFSRPINSSTPCTDTDYKTYPKSLYDTHATKYGRHSQGSSKYSPNKGAVMEKKSVFNSCDVSGWMLTFFCVFFVALAGVYYFTANPKSIEDGFNVVRGTVRDTLHFFYTYAILPVFAVALVGIVVFAAYHFLKHREQSKIEHNKKKIELVDRITDIIRDAQDDGIAEPHVRDLLIPPTKRSSEDWKLWGDAAEFINAEDSRVRTEVRLINGVECNVWVWVPITKQQKWQGSAVAEGSPSSNVPSKALSRCIKLRGLSFTDRMSDKIELRRDLRSKLGEISPVHMEFFCGPESVVYMMFKDLNDSKKAFSAFHSNWFSGCLLTAKYVPDSRYLERYPEARRNYS